MPSLPSGRGRKCEGCGLTMPFGRRRTKHPETGKMVCDGCNPSRPGSPSRPVGYHGSIHAPEETPMPQHTTAAVLDLETCGSCGAGIGDAGLIRRQGRLVCADGCKPAPKPQTVWYPVPGGTRTAAYSITAPEKGTEDDESEFATALSVDEAMDKANDLVDQGYPYAVVRDSAGYALETIEREASRKTSAEGESRRSAARQFTEGQEVFVYGPDSSPGRVLKGNHEDGWGGEVVTVQTPQGPKTVNRVIVVDLDEARQAWHVIQGGEIIAGGPGISEQRAREMAQQRGGEAVKGLGSIASRRKVAHDSGDGKTIYHCPFCGGGQVIARSDGTTMCGFCNTAFTIQVQPEHSSMPQTVDGQPVNDPSMPGDGTHDDDVVEDPAEPPADDFAPAAEEEPKQPNPFAAGLRTQAGKTLPKTEYLAHIALAVADDREAVLQTIRSRRAAR